LAVTVLAIATPLSTSGRFIVDAHGKRVRLAGVNWYGASEDMGVPVGLDSVNRNTLAELIAKQGFNCVRFPFGLWMTQQTTPVADQYLLQNPDLSGSTPMQVYDACVKALTDQGLIVIPNCHLLDFGWCCAGTDTNGLWFNDRWQVAQFTAAWQEFTRRYASNPLVAAMDIKNEPRPATLTAGTLNPVWGSQEQTQTDFAAMYTTVGNVIHEINPHLLIICEGLSYACDLTGVASHPVKLTQPDKVVYSMHDYSYFHANDQSQADYIAAMNKAGGYVLTEGIAPLWIGEFGDTASDLSASGGSGSTWWANIQAWLKEYDIDWSWWALNPVHGQSCAPGTSQIKYYWGQPEPYGLLTLDWTDVAYPAVVSMLQALMQPRTGPGITTT
jgi:aryl-phospho-beta-D-glucosidase BglC (GH1 family)